MPPPCSTPPRGTEGSNPSPSSGESDELPPEQARSPSDLEVVRYWDLAATERTKLNDRTRPSIERSFSGAALLGMLLMSPLSSGLNIRHKSRAIAVAIVQIRLPLANHGEGEIPTGTTIEGLVDPEHPKRARAIARS